MLIGALQWPQRPVSSRQRARTRYSPASPKAAAGTSTARAVVSLPHRSSNSYQPRRPTRPTRHSSAAAACPAGDENAVASKRRPPAFSGLATVSILTIDLDKGLWEVDADAVMTDAQTVYGSENGLYVASQKYVAILQRHLHFQERLAELPKAHGEIKDRNVPGTSQDRAQAIQKIIDPACNHYNREHSREPGCDTVVANSRVEITPQRIHVGQKHAHRAITVITGTPALQQKGEDQGKQRHGKADRFSRPGKINAVPI